MENQIQDPITPTPPPPKKNNLAVILLSILLVITLLISGYLFLQVQSLTKQLIQLQVQPTPTPLSTEIPSPTPDPTTGWKTYTNTRYGFSFKYPVNATYEITNFTNQDFGIMFNNLTEFPYEEMIISVGKNWGFTDPKGGTADKPNNYTLGGVPAYRENLPEGQNPPSSIVFVKRNGQYFTVQQIEDPKDPAIKTVFDQILSTFRFLK